jgi:hypothetical protein
MAVKGGVVKLYEQHHAIFTGFLRAISPVVQDHVFDPEKHGGF